MEEVGSIVNRERDASSTVHRPMRHEAVRPERSVSVAVAVDGGVDINCGRPVTASQSVG